MVDEGESDREGVAEGDNVGVVNDTLWEQYRLSRCSHCVKLGADCLRGVDIANASYAAIEEAINC